MMGRSLLGIAVVLTFGMAACGPDGPPANVHSYVDSMQRSCTVDLNDITQVATCNTTPTLSCASGTSAVFALNDGYDSMTHIWSLQSCAGCIDRPNHTTLISAMTCANVTCMTNADCLESSFMCHSGICTHM